MSQSQPLPVIPDDQLPAHPSAGGERGFGALKTVQGCLPLVAMDVKVRICGLVAQTTVVQTFVNTANEPVEATYIFPLPDRAAVTSFELRIGDRVIQGLLKERAAARQEYDEAIKTGHRAAIAEENRPDVFSLRVGNLMPGDRAVVTLALTGPLEYADGEATYRFPLVVAPRYIPGDALPGASVGPGTAADTNLTSDASLITPPVMLSEFPNPACLSLAAEIDPAGLSIGGIACSLHAVETLEGGGGHRMIRIQPGERLNRDFILRLSVAEGSTKSSAILTPDAAGDEGTLLVTLVPPAAATSGQRPRDVVLLLDRSGSMDGWKIVAARRAAARIVDSLTPADRFAVLAFDTTIETPPHEGSAEGLATATDRARYRAVEFLARLDSRGGTEMAEPLARATKLLSASDPARDRVLVLVTDGQVGNEDHILEAIAKQARELRIFTLGIDQAVNAGFLRRLAAIGGGACDLVESEDRLDDVMDKIHRRIGTPLLTGVQVAATGIEVDVASFVPARLPDLHAGVPLVVMLRYRAMQKAAAVTLSALDALGDPWTTKLVPVASDSVAASALWARGRIRDLEDRYAANTHANDALEAEIVATSLKFSVLSRFTAFVAVDRSAVVNAAGQPRTIVQPVELPAGWEAESVGMCRKKMQPAYFASPAAAAESDSGSCVIEFCDSALSMDEDVDEVVRSNASNPRGANSLGSFIGSIFGRGLLPQSPSMPANHSSRKRKVSSASVSDSVTRRVVSPDLSAYRSKAAAWLEELNRRAAGDASARLTRLRELGRNVANLVADLQSIGAQESDLGPLAKLNADLAQLSATSNAAQVEALWQAATQALAAFAGVRQPFWKKQSPVTA